MKNRQRKKFNRVNARKSWARKFEGMLLSAKYKPTPTLFPMRLLV